MHIFRRTHAEEMGLSSTALLKFFEQHRDLGIHSLAVVRQHKVLALSVGPWQEDLPHVLFSLSKSLCSMAAGIAVDEGLIRWDESVADVLKASLPKGYDRRLHDVQLRHLLSMSSGLDPRSDTRSLRARKDWARTVLGYRVLHEPGTVFHYNTLGTYLAGRMVASRTGEPLRDYLMPRLFGPLDIAKPQWDCCPLGHNTAGFGLRLSCMDIAKIAQLLLDRGMWNGQRLLSESYLDLATAKQVDNGGNKTNEAPDWAQGYGFQFWISRHGRYRGDGMYGQVMLVDQRHGLALAVTAGLNDMGAEMDALHQLMDDLMQLPAGSKKEQAALKALPRSLAVPPPTDDGSPLFGEGSYISEGHLLRLEIQGLDRMRLFLKPKGAPWPACLTFQRGVPYAGEYDPFVYGDGPSRYEGSLGVQDGVLTLRALMPQAPFMMYARIRPAGTGLHVELKGVHFLQGTFRFNIAG